MPEYDSSVLAIGVNIDIQRTDGRVHSAIVSGINLSTKSVTVEWYEKGEAKGKEIELEAIFKLNPNLRRPGASQDEISGTGDTTRTTHPNKDQSVASRRAAPPVSASTTSTTATTATSGTTSRNDMTVVPTSNNTELEVTIAPTPRVPVSSSYLPAPTRVPTSYVPPRSTVIPSGDDRNNQSRLATVNNNTVSQRHREEEPMDEDMDALDPTPTATAMPLDIAGFSHLGDLARDQDWMDQDTAEAGDESVPVVGLNNRIGIGESFRRPVASRTNMGAVNGANNALSSAVSASTTAAAAAAAAAAAGSRKSNCVKEIERIQQRREERRAAQRAFRDQLDLDPSNPSYEFHMMIQEYRNTLDYRPLTNADPIEDHQICVCVRKRPMNKKELARHEMDVITVPNKQHVLVHEPKTKVDLTKYLENQQFRFDYAFDDTSDNELVYRYTAKPLVECIFQRGMATCFAYGQTGSGKTHTMGGEFHMRGQQNCSNGIYALAAADVFNLNATAYKHEKLQVEAAFFEIYSGKVFDLLNKKAKLRVLEDAKGQVQIVGLREEPVGSVDAVLRLLQHGAHIRTSGQTSANQHSSRSHAVFQLILKKQATGKIHGKFSLIDLAGNERGVDTSSSDRHTRMEGAEINKSLLALKECIRALGRKGAHLPFRASKLTQVLRDSFIGDRSRTCMIAMISPGMASCEHTLNTLRYADRVKELGPANLSASNSSTDLPTPNVQQTISNRNPTTNNRVPSGLGSVNDSVLSSAAINSRLNYMSGAGVNQQTGASWQTNGSLLGDNRGLGGGLLPEDDDLAMLRSANEGEVPEELLHFHELVNQIEHMEEEICDDHKALCNSMTEWTKEHFSLYKVSNQVEFDVENYSNRLEVLLGKQIKALSSLKEKVTIWRRELRQEEELSTKLQRNRKL